MARKRKGPGCREKGKGAQGLETDRAREGRLLNGTCNACGGWGHRLAECPSVVRAHAFDQKEDTADFEHVTGAAETEPLTVGGIWSMRCAQCLDPVTVDFRCRSRAGMWGRGSGSSRGGTGSRIPSGPWVPLPVCPVRATKGVAEEDGRGCRCEVLRRVLRAELGILRAASTRQRRLVWCVW